MRSLSISITLNITKKHNKFIISVTLMIIYSLLETIFRKEEKRKGERKKGETKIKDLCTESLNVNV